MERTNEQPKKQERRNKNEEQVKKNTKGKVMAAQNAFEFPAIGQINPFIHTNRNGNTKTSSGRSIKTNDNDVKVEDAGGMKKR